MDVIDLGLPAVRKIGIPLRLPPANICDVNPWVCRMTPANINSVKGLEPAVARLTYEPFPRGCNCCAERLIRPNDEYEEPKSKKKSTKKGETSKECEPTKKNGKQKRKKQAEERYERVRLLRDKKRRCDFVTACCQGLMMTPCGSVDSCGSDLVEEKEQANFFIHTDCARKVNECATAKPANDNKKRADFPCSCRTCKYVKRPMDSKTGCVKTEIKEKTVCYCTNKEKNETDADENPSGPSPRKNQAVNDSPQCEEYQAPGACNTYRPTTENRVEDYGQPASKVLFTAALTQEMLIQLARNGIDTANCIPSNTQYLLDCRRLPCTPVVQQPDSGCRLYNCNQPVQSLQCPPIPDCNTRPNCNNSLQCTKVAEINCPPDTKCHVYNCEQPQSPRIKCTTLADCTTIYDLECQPDVTYCLNNYQQPSSPRPQCQQVVCEQGEYPKPISSRCNCNRSTRKKHRSKPRNRHSGSYKGSRYSKECGHICIPKGAVPDSAGDMCRSKVLIPLTFHPRKESFNSRSNPCAERSRRRRPAPQERMSSIQDNTKMFSSSRGIGEPSRLSHDRSSDMRYFERSNETHATKLSSSPNISPRNGSRHYGASSAGAIDQPPEVRAKNANGRIVKNEKTSKPVNWNNKQENERTEQNARKLSKQSEPIKNKRERRRSKSPSLVKEGSSSAVKATKPGVANKTKNESKKKSSEEKPGHKHTSLPHFDDVEPSRRASPPRNDYEAELMKAMDAVKRRYLEQSNYDTTASSDPKSQATTGTEPCLTPTYQEFMCLTEQIKRLRKELKKYCSAE